jgi:hypothetical protein
MNETGQDAPGAFLLRGVREQGAAARRRHWRRKTRVLVAAGAVVAVTAAGVTAALLAGSVSDPPSALAALTSALAKTSEESYSFSLDSTVEFEARESRSDAVSGAFDLRHELGTELLTARVARSSGHSRRAQIRFIGKYVYTRVSPGSGLGTIGKPWDKAPVPSPGADVLPAGDLYGFVTDWPVSPDELLGVLQSAATARDSGPVSGPGWTGTRYAFTARLSAQWSVSGTVYVDKQGRVRRLITTTRQKSGVTTDRDLAFGDFGAPVPVTAPPASQVQYSSRPYWGFYF